MARRYDILGLSEEYGLVFIFVGVCVYVCMCGFIRSQCIDLK